MTGPSMVMALIATALLVEPGRTRRSRLSKLLPKPRRQVSPLACSPAVWLAVGAAATTVGGVGWPGGVLLAGPVAVATWFLASRLRRRHARRAREPTIADSLRLAATWDLLAACLRAGLPVPTAVRAVAEGAPDREAAALLASADLLALGADPVEAWAPALACDGTAELARSARRTARSGSALAVVGAELANQIRAGIDDEAEAKAQRAGVLITGPLGLCFLPAFLCLGVVPVVLGLAARLAVPH